MAADAHFHRADEARLSEALATVGTLEAQATPPSPHPSRNMGHIILFSTANLCFGRACFGCQLAEAGLEAERAAVERTELREQLDRQAAEGAGAVGERLQLRADELTEQVCLDTQLLLLPIPRARPPAYSPPVYDPHSDSPRSPSC